MSKETGESKMNSIHPKKIEIPQDLKVEIGSKEQKAWSDLAKANEEALLSLKRNVEVTQVVIDFSRKREAEEKEKFEKGVK